MYTKRLLFFTKSHQMLEYIIELERLKKLSDHKNIFIKFVINFLLLGNQIFYLLLSTVLLRRVSNLYIYYWALILSKINLTARSLAIFMGVNIS